MEFKDLFPECSDILYKYLDDIMKTKEDFQTKYFNSNREVLEKLLKRSDGLPMFNAAIIDIFSLYV
ncbi:hypothetical protein Cyrtocomes_01188 [Candidatus Cyrtobacter comes]|uniref:Uncharacterized protein n=1 Tax=Candidatus Cyrtobacter comes TaxID=675776 RepID=A0ABU5L9J9_9RICK|nr:hypothetical protein [Candidatus Cyrtobacter comes]MDZ5762793.1 hypothetical protein [Candidatus Cyrtobacter comes]